MLQPGNMFVRVNYSDSQNFDFLSPEIPYRLLQDRAALMRKRRLSDSLKSILMQMPPIHIYFYEYTDFGEIDYNIHIVSEKMKIFLENIGLVKNLLFVRIALLQDDNGQESESLIFYAVHYPQELWKPCLRPMLAYKRKSLWLPCSNYLEDDDYFAETAYDVGNALLVLDRRLVGDTPLFRVSNEVREPLAVREDVLEKCLQGDMEGFDFDEVIVE